MTKIYVEISDTLRAVPTVWTYNQFEDAHLLPTGQLSADLKDDTDTATGVSLHIDAAFGNSGGGSSIATADAGEFDDVVLDSAMFTTNGGTGTLRLAGLPSGASYTIDLTGHTSSSSRHTAFTVEGSSQDYLVGSASSPTAPVSFSGTVDLDGEIVIDVTKAASGQFYGYINGFILEYTTGPTGLTIDSTDSTMQRGTNFELVCSGATTVPTTDNTTLTNGNDTLTPLSVTGSDPYTITFAVGDLTKQVDVIGYNWTLSVGTTQTGLGYQPVGTANPSDVNLVHNFNSVLESAYQGYFHLPRYKVNAHPELPNANYEGARWYPEDGSGLGGGIAFGSSATSLFISGASGSYDNIGQVGNNQGGMDSICEYTMPSLYKPADINDRSGVSSATQVQDWSAVFNPNNSLTTIGRESHTVNGLHYDRAEDTLFISVQHDYDSLPYAEGNLIAYRDPDDLLNSDVDGEFSVRHATAGSNEPQHCAGWMADVPSSFQTALGGGTLFGGGATASVLARLPNGPTMFVGDLPDTGSTGNVIVERHLDYSDAEGEQLGAYFFPGRVDGLGTWYQFEMFNADRTDPTPYIAAQELTDYTQVDPWINDFWNIESRGLQGFLIPGTQTYAVVGILEAGEFGAGYKAWPPWLDSRASGAVRIGEFDLHNKYWLFDVRTMQAATNPWEVFPYEHGYIDLLDGMENKDGARAMMHNATFDLHTGRLAVIMKARTSVNEADVVVFQTDDWKEAVT